MGLLETQSFKIDDPKYKKMFETHVDRLKAMSLMHKSLYSTQSYEQVDIKAYLEEIAHSLRTFTTHKITTDIDNITLDMKIAMNIGLIFNEAVTNAIEHAFYDNSVGNIDIALKEARGRCVLTIVDNGRGYDTTKKYKSLGLTLIKDLSATLPKGNVHIEGKEGTRITIYFNVEGQH